MGASAGARGAVSTIVAIVVALLLFGVALWWLGAIPQPSENPPQWEFLGFYVEGRKTDVALVGDEVELRLSVRGHATWGSIGDLVVEIVKDRVLSPDEVFESKLISLRLMPNQADEVAVRFVPDEPCVEGTGPLEAGKCHSYFFRLKWRGQYIYKPSSRSRPSLFVVGEEILVPSVDYAGGEFEGTGPTGAVRGDRITVLKDTYVAVYVRLRYSDLKEEVAGTLRVQVKKDKVLKGDVVYAVLSKEVTLPAGSGTTDWIKVGEFLADEVTSGNVGATRQYFIKVFWGETCIHDPANPDLREAVFVVEKKTEVGYSSGEFEGTGPS